jgi:hypothetical protein
MAAKPMVAPLLNLRAGILDHFIAAIATQHCRHRLMFSEAAFFYFSLLQACKLARVIVHS